MPKAKTKNTEIISPHHYVYPNTTTLKNKYGTKNLNVFLEKCSHDTTDAMVNLREESLPECFDTAYLCHIHHQLFKNTFEWAGYLRHIPFTFADGTTAAMPEMKRTGWQNAFAIGDEIQEGLQRLDQTLAEKNNLQGLTREKFNSEAIELFNSLNQLHPFREGNGRTQRLFFENLAKAAGHQLNFSFITKERMMVASVAVAENGDLEPMQHLFEDISNPEKICLLKEFMDTMKNTGRNVSDRPVMVAKEGETYTGTYRGAGLEGFALNVKGAYIIGNKDHLPPEQQKTLKPGDKITFIAPKVEELKRTLIPKETLAPLTKLEIAEMVAEDALVHKCREQICSLSKTVYGRQGVLNKEMIEIIKHPNKGQQLAAQIEKAPFSFHSLAGIDLICFKTGARVRAEKHAALLSYAVTNFTCAVKHARQEITKEHQAEQNRCRQEVPMPSQNLQDLLSMPKQFQQKALGVSPLLQKELTSLLQKVNSRLSSSEQRALRENNHETLAKNLGVSEQKAKEITKTVMKAREVQQKSQARTVIHSKTLAMAS
ncbi:adenosine monophosphate-protein transferase [Bartonella henselae]|uniref:protein adenylyltransferase n=1 Tax=Bartonella henselae TaxID=38323 RepID=I3QKD5_BARHN|nr:BID domain-containing T4SS effector [Bartonella henselae]AFK10357.1 BepA [Bartonella henselae]MDM9996702.1 BID domain-containing T4SS effector [Bartonella henselae]MDN0003781.1 BID domain-containing T4SS effector [Bartonella henselae]OLL47125.1 adenosine monophosphate-protein transferase [Bartonella henselae]OLL51674.1 adenosine monophosphate-protein transferase [Bartonella henselae]